MKRKRHDKHTNYLEFMSCLLRTTQIICAMKRNIGKHLSPLKKAWHTGEFSLQYTATITAGPKPQETLIRLVHTTAASEQLKNFNTTSMNEHTSVHFHLCSDNASQTFLGYFSKPAWRLFQLCWTCYSIYFGGSTHNGFLEIPFSNISEW